MVITDVRHEVVIASDAFCAFIAQDRQATIGRLLPTLLGRLDADALFYLRSRGLGEPEARVLLTRGFANEIVAELASTGRLDDLARAMGEQDRVVVVPGAEE